MRKAGVSGFISVADAAMALGVTPRQVRNLVKSGILPADLVGGSYVVRRADLAKVPSDRKPGPKPARQKRVK